MAFPLSTVTTLYESFGLFSYRSEFIQIRQILLTLVIVVCTINLVLNNSHWLRLFSVNCYLFLVVYIAIIVTVNMEKSGEVREEMVNAPSYFAPLIFTYISHFLIGLHILDFKKYRSVFLILLSITCVVILQFVDYTIFRIDVKNYVEGANIGNYQGIGDSLAVLSLLVVGLYRNTLLRIAVIIASLIILFFIGSRTSFAVYGLVTSLFIVLSTRFFVTLPILIILALGLVLYGTSVDIDDLESRNSRMVGIFTDYSEDNSIIGRKNLDQIGWEDISNSPILGDFGGQIRVTGAWSAYMHNFYSYWRQFGIAAFLAVVALYLWFVVLSINAINKIRHFGYNVPFLLCSFLMLESIISRSFTFGRLHLFFGVLVALHAYLIYGHRIHARAQGNSSTKRKRKRRRRKESSSAT